MTECNNCGECCKNPCLLGEGDVKRIAEYIGKSPQEFLTVWKEPNGKIKARPLLGFDGYCHFRKDGLCSIHEVKPAGGKDFECWNPERTAPGRENRFFIKLHELKV